jgi:hypothetical protein
MVNKMQFLIGYDPGSFPVDLSGGHTVLRELAKQLSILGQRGIRFIQVKIIIFSIFIQIRS